MREEGMKKLVCCGKKSVETKSQGQSYTDEERKEDIEASQNTWIGVTSFQDGDARTTIVNSFAQDSKEGAPTEGIGLERRKDSSRHVAFLSSSSQYSNDDQEDIFLEPEEQQQNTSTRPISLTDSRHTYAMTRESYEVVNPPAFADTKEEQRPELAAAIYSRFKSHEWHPSDIRAHPQEAFELFDANGDGVITMAELCFAARRRNADHRRRGSLFDELKLFSALDLDGDAIISKRDWHNVISDPNAFSDAALQSISKLCELRFQAVEEQVVRTAYSQSSTTTDHCSKDEDDDDDHYQEQEAEQHQFYALSASTGILRGTSLLQRNESRESFRKSSGILSSKGSSKSYNNSTSLSTTQEERPLAYDLILDLVAVSLLSPSSASTPHQDAWYDIFSLVGGREKTAASDRVDAYLTIMVNDTVLASTEIQNGAEIAIKFNPLRIAANAVNNVLNDDGILELGFYLYTRPSGLFQGTNEVYHLGTSKLPTKIPQPNIDVLDIETAIGPLAILDTAEKITAKLLGSSQWVLATDGDQASEDEDDYDDDHLSSFQVTELCLASNKNGTRCFDLCYG